MKQLVIDFFKAWEEEIALYQEVALALTEQKLSLMKWDLSGFQEDSKEVAFLISKAHKNTDVRNSLLDSIFTVTDNNIDENSLETVQNILDVEEDKERAKVFLKVFTNTIKNIDKLSDENKDLIKTGLELVGENLEMIADIIDRDRVYSRVGMINQKRSSLVLNKRV